MTDMLENSEELSVLKSKINKPIDNLETFPAPKSVTVVKFFTDELTSICPITGQPDFGELTIEYEPNKLCLESKSLKLYLWTFREEGHFCEALASEITQKIFDTLKPKWVRVTNEQSKRGGIETTAVGYIEE